MNRVLIVAVHPDDETLGCGGTILKHLAHGDEVMWLICTDLAADHEYRSERRDEIDRVANAYGIHLVHKLGLNTTRVDDYPLADIVEMVSKIIEEYRPSILYMPFKNDVHSDHRVIFQAAYSCTKSFRYPYVKTIYMMETLSETEFGSSVAGDQFTPNVYVDVTPYMKKKIDIMALYRGEMRPHPFPRSEECIRALGRIRGAVAGCDYAESFQLLRDIR